ncbi:MAG: hypothetical protein KJO08_04935, partial [Gammaproteobacteria bacterium]|nr:hypothetical protein [Gammaproteobacteria bacterium]
YKISTWNPIRAFGILLFLANSGVAYPETQTLIAPPEWFAQPLAPFDGAHPDKPHLSGRLFFSDEQRRILDRLRDQYREHKTQATRKEQTTEVPEESLTINGVVIRSHGDNTVWINGKPVSGNDLSQGEIRAIKRSDNTVGVEVFRGRNSIRLKPGQRAIVRGEEVLEVR